MNITLSNELLILIAFFIVLVPYGLYIYCHAIPNAIAAEQKKKEQKRGAFLCATTKENKDWIEIR